MNRNGNSANFFSYVCNGEKIKDLFASTSNGRTASVIDCSRSKRSDPVNCGARKQKRQ